MITLQAEKGSFDLELPYGIVATVRPLTTPAMLAAQAAARRLVERDAPKGAEPEAKDGLYQAHLIYELATRHITAVKGVEVEGGGAAATPDNIRALMDLYPVGERFYQEFTLRQVLLNAAKKRIKALCGWHFQRGGGPDYCAGCQDLGLECEACPYKVNEPVHDEEFQAWDTLMAALGQLRVSPSGHVLGIDITAAFAIAQARGYPLSVLSELLQEAEMVLVQSLNAKPEDHGNSG